MTKLNQVAVNIFTFAVVMLAGSFLVSSSVQAAPDINLIKQKAQQAAQLHLQEKETDLISPLGDQSEFMAETSIQSAGLKLDAEVYRETVISSWLNGKVMFRDINGQHYLSLFRQ
jgi:hypothetical protein